jgi:hypothetical protein
MKVPASLTFFLLFLPTILCGQSLRMSPDFFPLEVGNRWVYEVHDETGRKVGDIDFSVQERTIISGRSYYVLTRFPFVAELGGLIRLIRYDRQEHEYLRRTDDAEDPLFFADGARTEVLEADSSGVAMKFILHLDTMDLTFERGVGIIAARIPGPDGSVRIAKIVSGKIRDSKGAQPAVTAPTTNSTSTAPAQPTLPAPKTAEQKTRDLIENVTSISEEIPHFDIESVVVAEGHKLILTVTKTSDKLLPFHFDSSQSFDFSVIDPDSGQEIWRWSRKMFFTRVLRSEAISPKKAWKFEAVWNHRDNDLEPVPPGTYQIIGIVAVQPSIQSDPVSIEVK